MSNARNNILQRLREPQRPPLPAAERHAISRYTWEKPERMRRFTERMQAVRAEVHMATHTTWLAVVSGICRDKSLHNLLIARETAAGQAISAQASCFPPLKYYDRLIEDWKDEMFQGIDAALTSTRGGIAETGTLIVWPDAYEPRQMSLVPPVHIALLDTDKLYTTFAEAIQAEDWVAEGMPTNALLISGPSKSADIEQTLAYGVHGPKELVVILLNG